VSEGGLIAAASARRSGYKPSAMPVASSSNAYTHPDGMTLVQCGLCGRCERFVGEANAEASPKGPHCPMLLAEANLEIRLGAHVTGIDYDRRAKRVIGVRYVDRESGAGYLQPADIVILTAVSLTSTRFLLL